MGLIDCQETYDERTGHLARNLSIVAALCAAFYQGTDAACCTCGDVRGWTPGCGRAA